MLRWDITLHPSWDRMYKSRMTVREISDLTGGPLSTVHRHLQVGETYVDEIRAIHDAAQGLVDLTGPPLIGNAQTRLPRSSSQLTAGYLPLTATRQRRP